jgi:hypothetical protein
MPFAVYRHSKINLTMSIMKPKFFIIAAVLGMGLFALSTFAQNVIVRPDGSTVVRHTEETVNTVDNDPEAAIRRVETIRNRQAMRTNLFNGADAYLEAVGLLAGVDSIREEFGLSRNRMNELRNQAVDNARPILQNDPVYRSLQDAKNRLGPYDISAADAEEKLMKLSDIQEKMFDMERKKVVSLLCENFTPDQIKIINEFHISYMSETEIIFPGMFEALDLSDEQRQQFDKILKEMEPVFDEYIDLLVELQLRQQEFANKIGNEANAITDPDERKKFWESLDFVKKRDAELQPERDKVMKSGKKVSDEMKIKMFDVLTDKQWKRMIDLIDNPPDYVKKILAERRKARENDANKPGAWQPGPNSWRPGDPIPEQYRQQRQEQIRTRNNPGFPRTATPEE